MAFIYNDQTGDFDYIETAPIIRSFRICERTQLYEKDEITLCWQIDDANHIYLNGIEQSTNQFKTILNAAGSIKFTIRATNADGIVERDLILDVHPIPKFDITQSALVLHKEQNEPLTIGWKIENAKDIKLIFRNKQNSIPTFGEIVDYPESDTQYEFQATGIDGNRIFHHTMMIKVCPSANISFKINRHFSYPNLPLRLSWEVENATSISIDDFGQQPSRGQIEVSPGKDTTYVLRVQDAFGEVVRSITVRMLPIPAIKQLLVPIPQINEKFDISYTPPQFKVKVPIPTFEFPLIKLGLPHIPTLKESFFVKKVFSNKHKKRFNPFKSLFSYFVKI